MKVCSVVGARPQFVKLSPIDAELRRRGHEHVIVHTGQHYDKEMSTDFFADLGISTPNANLEIGSGSHGRQTGRMLEAIEGVLLEQRPTWTVVYGDTNSTVAASLAASKLAMPVAHLEAGLRSFNREMPEELNRVATDHLSDLLLAPTELAMSHLGREGLLDRSILVGDVMTDVLYRVRDTLVSADVDSPNPSQTHHSNFWLATIHRPSNTDDKDQLEAILTALQSLPNEVVLAAHPRLRAAALNHGLRLQRSNIRLVPPLTYRDLVKTVMNSKGVVTDSGGLQKEAFLLRRPCVTIRTETEWGETVDLGWNQLCPNPADLHSMIGLTPPDPTDATPYGDGNAAARTVDALERLATVHS